MSFGFRAVAIDTEAELGKLLQRFDLDVMRARRLAKIVAGWRLAEDLALMREHAGGEACRGMQGLAESWLDRKHPQSALAQLCDVACDQALLADDLATVATKSRIDISAVRGACESPNCLDISSAAWSTTRALLYGLIAGRTLNRFSWEGDLNVGAAIDANAGDCFTAQDFGRHTQSS